jgi:TetR/AcrR family transcriptional regulator, regulator of cefoperazone and chloramphenicol sensitivity
VRPPTLMSDPTAKSRVREAALVLFAENGVAGTSLRAIAAAAGVSPGLVIHHFGSKDGLRGAVDAHVVARIDAVLERSEDADRQGPPLVRLLRTDPTLVQYLGRALCEDAEVGRQLFDRMFPQVAPGAGRQPVHRAEFWSSVQQLALIVGPLFLLRFVERELGGSLLDSDSLEQWIDANARLVESGLARPSRRVPNPDASEAG